MEKLRILIACEESQEVCKAFRELGHEAFSCDILPCSGGHPEWHIQEDIFHFLHGTKRGNWDLIIGHPPCTYLCNSGVSWLYNKDGSKNKERWKQMERGALFFKSLLNQNCEMIAIENPIPHKYALKIIERKYDQIIQPYMFGHPERKATCFWLVGLPKLKSTRNVKKQMEKLPKSKSQRIHYTSPGKDRAKIRSKTFKGIAKAMAKQWSEYLTELNNGNDGIPPKPKVLGILPTII